MEQPKGSINELWNTLDGTNSRVKGEEQINDLEDRVIESKQAEQKSKNMQNYNRSKEISDSINCNNIHII